MWSPGPSLTEDARRCSGPGPSAGFQTGTQPLWVSRWLAKAPFQFPSAHFPIGSWLLPWPVLWPPRSGVCGCRLLSSRRRAAGCLRAGLAAAVSMVTAPPAAGPLGEDAACRARRLAPGLSVRRGSLRSGGPAGSGHQVSLPRGGGGRGRPARVLAVPASSLVLDGAEASRWLLRPFSPPHPLHFFLANTPRKSSSWKRLRSRF